MNVAEIPQTSNRRGERFPTATALAVVQITTITGKLS
jgi:hypothetical protein